MTSALVRLLVIVTAWSRTLARITLTSSKSTAPGTTATNHASQAAAFISPARAQIQVLRRLGSAACQTLLKPLTLHIRTTSTCPKSAVRRWTRLPWVGNPCRQTIKPVHLARPHTSEWSLPQTTPCPSSRQHSSFYRTHCQLWNEPARFADPKNERRLVCPSSCQLSSNHSQLLQNFFVARPPKRK